VKNAALSDPESASGVDRVSSTGQIDWKPSPQGQSSGTFLVNAPRVRCAVGYLQERAIELDDVVFTLKRASNGWASLGLAALDNQPIANSKRMLLVAVGRVANSDMQWNEQRTSVAEKWGHAPTIAEGIGASVRLPGSVTARALTPSGEASQTVPVHSHDGSSDIEIGPQYQTLWYLLTRE
jgi:hypothetical protein